MADLRRRNGPPDGFPAAVISRVIIRVDGPPGAGKTTFVERLLGEPDGAARLLEQLVGGPVVALARERPELCADQAVFDDVLGLAWLTGAPSPRS